MPTKYDNTQKVVCPECGGNKRVHTGWEDMGHSRGSYHTYEDCPTCLGEGIVLKSTTYKPISTCESEMPTTDTLSGRDLQKRSEIIKHVQLLTTYTRVLIQKLSRLE